MQGRPEPAGAGDPNQPEQSHSEFGQRHRIVGDAIDMKRWSQRFRGFDADGTTPLFNFTGPGRTFMDDLDPVSRWRLHAGLRYFFQ